MHAIAKAIRNQPRKNKGIARQSEMYLTESSRPKIPKVHRPKVRETKDQLELAVQRRRIQPDLQRISVGFHDLVACGARSHPDRQQQAFFRFSQEHHVTHARNGNLTDSNSDPNPASSVTLAWDANPVQILGVIWGVPAASSEHVEWIPIIAAQLG
jgi:hypothetical protein